MLVYTHGFARYTVVSMMPSLRASNDIFSTCQSSNILLLWLQLRTVLYRKMPHGEQAKVQPLKERKSLPVLWDTQTHFENTKVSQGRLERGCPRPTVVSIIDRVKLKAAESRVGEVYYLQL